jgi:hypothetical protein
MPSKAPNGKQIDRHRTGYHRDYAKQKREGKHSIFALLSDTEFEAVSTRAKKDGLTKQEAARMSLLNYAKHGLDNG